jgi:hypothetical protein
LHHFGAARGACRWHPEGSLPPASGLLKALCHLRDDVSSTLDAHQIADAHVLALDHLAVMERGA